MKEPVIKLGSLSIPVMEYASQGNAVLGIRDSGKTYTATYMAEQLLKRDIPFVAFDPIGVWRYLKVPGKGEGFKVVVAGGDHGDLPLTPESAPEIVRAAMLDNIPLILDLYSMELSKADWKRIVKSSVELLLYANKKHGLRHIFIEEAAEFAPQKVGPDQGVVYSIMEKLARMGGNASLGYTLINQRAEEVNKAILELCDLLFLHRQKGRNSLQNLEKWLQYADRDKAESIVQSIPTLKSGQCWIWPQGSSDPILVSMPEKDSLHPDRRRPNLEKNVKPAEVGMFVEKLKGSLTKQLEKAKENDPEELKKKIRVLEKELQKKAVPPSPEPVQVPVIEKETIEVLRAHASVIKEQVQQLQGSLVEHRKSLEQIEATIHSRLNPRETFRQALKQTWSVKPLPVKSPVESDGAIPSGARRILIALAQRSPLTRNQLAVRAGFAQSGTFSNYISALRVKALIDTDSGDLSITEWGIKTLGNYSPLPVGRELFIYWHKRLPTGCGAILEYLFTHYPQKFFKEQLAQATNFALSGTFSNYISKLKVLELITVRDGLVQASEELYE